MSNTELNPCSCGGEPKIATFDWGYSVREYWCYCSSCERETKSHHSKEEAINDWNGRKIST